MDILATLSQEISAATGQDIQLATSRSLGGGSINRAIKASAGNQDYFIKLNDPELLDMFAAETAGLKELAESGAIGVPEVVCSGANNQYAWLVIEYIPLGSGNKQSFAEAGRALATLHKNIHDRFGWHRDNTIGSTPQINHYCDSWTEFWQKYRFGYQIEVAINNGYRGKVIDNVEKLAESCDQFFTHSPEPSLLHGDLWSGNLSFDREGRPVIYDPAVYYGDREADLAMTELFGGFSHDFYAAYNNAWSVDSGYAVRKTLYNLYHILNHMNLFGGGYQAQAIAMSDRLLSELR